MLGLQSIPIPALLIALLVLGACGLFLAMPSGRASLARVGYVLLAAAGGVLLSLVLSVVARESGVAWFSGCALVALFAAIRVITHARPVYSALYFVLLVVAVTALLITLQATFLATALVIVYAGAILVTYVFVIMLAQQARPPMYDTQARDPFLGCLAGFLLLTILASQLFVGRGGPAPDTAAVLAGTVDNVGTRLLTEYVIALQMIGLLLLAALVGAIAIARRDAPTQREGGDEC